MRGTEENPIPFKLSSMPDDDAAPRVVPHPDDDAVLKQALMTDPTSADDWESRVAARLLSKEALTAQAIAEMPEDSFKTEEEKFAAASKIAELMTGQKDYDGRLWNGGKGFKTGAEYLRSVKEVLSRGTQAAMDPDLQAWMRMTDEEKDAKLDAEQGVLSKAGERVGDIAAGIGEMVRGVPRLSKEEYASAPDDVREASDAMGSAMFGEMPEAERKTYEAKVSEWRGSDWQKLKRRSEYEAKLKRKNALVHLPDMIRSLNTDEAKELAGELAQNPQEIPANWTARLKALPTRDIETLAQIRGMTREHVEGGFFNWLGDTAIGVYNAGRNLIAGLGEQEAKYAAMAMGWDAGRINETIQRKHALWNAYAGWSSPIESMSDEHEAIANFTIGLASAVPFVMSLKMKALGFTACATEMMSEADAKAAAEGIDVTNPAYCAQSALMGGLYAYCLKAVSPKFFGATASGTAEEMALRTAFMKGVLSGCAKLDTAKVLSQRTASGAFMMAMQQGISAINEDLNLGGDAWRDASQHFAETFVSSIPDMLAFSAHGALEGHARASGGWRKMFGAEGRANRSQNLREAVENAFAVKTAVNGDKIMDRRLGEIRKKQLAAMYATWAENGENGLKRLGMNQEQIGEFKDFIEAERELFGSRARQEARLDELERATDAESLEEIDEDALAERNDAEKRYAETEAEIIRGRIRLFESLRDEKGAVRDLASVRNVWAEGHAVGAGKGDGEDVGAAALERAGFSKDDAAALSAAFGAERRAMYSPAAAETLRELYTRSTRGQVEAAAALTAAFGGRVRTVEGRTYLDFPMPDGGTGTLAVETGDMSSRFYGGEGDSMGLEVEKASGGAVKAAEWEKMPDAKRREAVDKYRLAVEGDFSVIDPSDPTLSVSAMDAERIVGRIMLDPSADPGAAFHEAFHGFSRFCRETGFFDEADLKWLHETYGDARQGGEQFDEEAGAEGFRRYAAMRLAGAAEDAAASPWRKMFALVQRMRHLRERNAAVERIATNAEEALYDQLLAGRYAHIRDLVFTEPAAPKAETGDETAAPQTGAKPVDESRGGGGELVQPPPPETTGNKDSVDESQNGNGELVQLPRVVSFEALTPIHGKKVKGHYEIVPLAKLLHSNRPGYPMELQQRNRKDNKGEETTRNDHVNNFEAGYLLDDKKTDSGAMIVARRPGADGKPQIVVVSGNGRTMVLEELANRHLYDRYRNRMKEWAKDHGVENAVADADNPVLVRVLDDLGGETLEEIARLSNKNGIQQMDEEETARADADLVRSLDLARLYVPNLDGSPNMAAGASDAFLSAFVRAIDDTSLQNSDGTFTEALRLRARRALLAIACGQGPRGRETVKKLVEDAPGLERQKEIAAAIAPHVAAVEMRPEYAIGPDVSRAFADYVEFRENREAGAKWASLDEYLKQGDMLDQRSEIAESIMRLLDNPKGAPMLAETVRHYSEAAKGEVDGLFGAARTRAEIWRDALAAAPETAKRYSIAVTPDEDAAYADAVKRGDKEAYTRLMREVAARRGYTGDSSYQGTSAFNGAAPSRNAYFETKEERIEATKRGDMEDTTTLGDYRDGIDLNNLQFIVFDPRSERNADPERKEAIRNIRQVLDSGAKTITMYRSVPGDVKESQFRNGDWITPSRAYAEENARIHGWGDKYRVIEQEVSVEDVWWDGNDIAEWGFDDGRESVYKNTAFNRKMLEPTYDDAGNLIPLSKRFNDWKDDIRYSIGGRIGAANMGIGNMRDAEQMEKDGASRKDIWRKTGWWRGKDGAWRIEIPPLKMKSAKDIETALREGGNEAKLGMIVDAPELFKAYPDMKNVKVEFDPKGLGSADAQYNRRRDVITIFNAGLESIADLPPVMVDRYNHYYQMANSETYLRGRIEQMDGFHIEHGTFEEEREKAKQRVAEYERGVAERNALVMESLASRDDAFSVFSRLNHEVQHAIQEREHFAAGSSPAVGIYDPSNTPSERAIDEYRRAAGEVEARNVQTRLGMTAEQRAATPPWETEDVAEARQIVRFSVVSLGGRDVAVAETEPLTTREAQDEEKVREVLMPIVGQEFPQLGEVKLVKIDGNFPDYFWNSNTSQNLRRVGKLWRAKVSAIPILGDILKTTPLGPKEAAEHLKKDPSFKDRAVFYRCTTEFGIKRHDGVAVYPCDLLVMEMTDNGNRYVYDIVRMKKPTLTAKTDLSSETLSQLYERHLTGESATSAPEGTADNIPNPADEIKRDPEAFARKSIVSRMEQGGEDEKESALVAFVAERALRHGPKPNAIKTIGRIGLELGLKAVDTGRIIRKGEALAERVRGTVIERAVKNGDAATAVALLARESDIDRAVDEVVAGAAEWGGKLTESGKGRIKSILEREIEKTVRSFNAASLADVERDTGIDIAGEILANSPEKFDPKSAGKGERTAEAGGAANGEGGDGSLPDDSAGETYLSDYETARRQRVRKEAEERVAKMIATAKERTEKAKKERDAWEQQREERKRKAEEAAAASGDGVAGEGGGDGESGGRGGEMSDRPKLSTFADFKSPEEFAAFFRVWAEDRYKKEHGTSTLGKHEEKRLFPEFYRKAVVRELQDLADKLLPPKGARATVNRWLGEIQPGVRPDTLERISADVFAYINRNAIRESRTAQIQKFRNGLQEFVKGPQFDDLKMDADRKVTGWVEEAARYIRRVCNLSIRSINGEPSQLEQERAELQAILDRREKVYDDEGKNAADAPKFDMETRRALAKLQLLDKYGAMKRYMPGKIADLADEAMRWLKDEATKLDEAWREARETEDQIRGDLTVGIVGPNGQRYQKGKGAGAWFDGLFDSLNGMIRLRLQHLVRFADSKTQQKAKDAINRVVVMLGDGEVAFARHLQDDRAAFHKALAQIFATPDGKGVDRAALADWLNRMTEAIPKELSAKLSKQGYADSMTYGQMLQLLVSLEQRSYAEAIETNGRDGQAALIRTFETVGPDGRRERVLTDKDILFIDWLRSFYEAKRGLLSSVTRRMVGLDIDSPDPLYCPVKIYRGDVARGMHADSSQAWDPIGAVFSRRVETMRDFDESASILGQFFDRSAASANLVAWGERGSVIRGVFTSPSVQESIRRAFGGGELTKILRQLEETFNGGENIKKSPGEIAAADKAMNWMTYLSLGYNPLSAAKQTTSFTVWANALPGGFSDLWRYMTDVDMATIKHIRESEAYKVRYGNEVGSGHDVASKGLFENPSENPVAAFFRKTSMGLLRKGDFLPGGWIAQGLFRDLYNRHLKEGMDADAADRLAMTETFNMLEETQQSGRTYNTAALAREHGRLGRLLVQFATSPLQQLQYETQAARELRDLIRYRPPTPDADYEKRLSDARGKLVRAAVINHVLLPAALHAVTNLYRLAMGYDPEWEKEGWHWSLFRDVVMGQFSRVFFLGAISSVTTDVLITGKPVRDVPALIPAEGVVKLFGNITVTARDVMTLDHERVQKDIDRLLKSTSVTRTPYDIIRRATGHSDADEKKKTQK